MSLLDVINSDELLAVESVLKRLNGYAQGIKSNELSKSAEKEEAIFELKRLIEATKATFEDLVGYKYELIEKQQPKNSEMPNRWVATIKWDYLKSIVE